MGLNYEGIGKGVIKMGIDARIGIRAVMTVLGSGENHLTGLYSEVSSPQIAGLPLAAGTEGIRFVSFGATASRTPLPSTPSRGFAICPGMIWVRYRVGQVKGM